MPAETHVHWQLPLIGVFNLLARIRLVTVQTSKKKEAVWFQFGLAINWVLASGFLISLYFFSYALRELRKYVAVMLTDAWFVVFYCKKVKKKQKTVSPESNEKEGSFRVKCSGKKSVTAHLQPLCGSIIVLRWTHLVCSLKPGQLWCAYPSPKSQQTSAGL